MSGSAFLCVLSPLSACEFDYHERLVVSQLLLQSKQQEIAWEGADPLDRLCPVCSCLFLCFCVWLSLSLFLSFARPRIARVAIAVAAVAVAAIATQRKLKPRTIHKPTTSPLLRSSCPIHHHEDCHRPYPLPGHRRRLQRPTIRHPCRRRQEGRPKEGRRSLRKEGCSSQGRPSPICPTSQPGIPILRCGRPEVQPRKHQRRRQQGHLPGVRPPNHQQRASPRLRLRRARQAAPR